MRKIVSELPKFEHARLPEGLARYFFNHRDALHFCLDREGACFETLEAARYEARQSVRELISHTLLTDDIVRWESAIEIVDEQGQIVQVVSYLEAADLVPVKDLPH
jgi:hypothetical protein